MKKREIIIKKYAQGKNVLDIGSVGQSEQKYKLWDFLEKYTSTLVGIDMLPSSKQNIIQGNMETYNFNKKFDVIVAGDIIEHVDNQGLLLNNIKRHLKNNGKFILSTQNAKWFLYPFVKHNPTHTLVHDPDTLTNILERFGFEIEIFEYYDGNKYHNIIEKILCQKKSMVVVCRKKR